MASGFELCPRAIAVSYTHLVAEQIYYSSSLFEHVPAEEHDLYNLYGAVTLISYPVVFILSLIHI